MTKPAIRVENLSKRYRIGAAAEPYKTFRESLVKTLTSPVRRLSRWAKKDSSAETIWALKDVSFEVQPGEVVGVVGRNGAGKSTFLKILSRITAPTDGYAEIRGRVGSLLEVGTGFHQELTGRENIFLNGAILGMKRREILSRFDEIVAFAEIDQFIDTPVKRYSSGMYMRLAFAVAAHLEPEILLVDEVLAVGDAGFQKKCLGKMGQVANQGRTVLFVSHNMAAIQQLCRRVIALKEGRVWQEGGSEVIPNYLNSLAISAPEDLANRADIRDAQTIWFTGLFFANQDGERVSVAVTGQELNICLRYDSRGGLRRPDFAFTLYDRLGQPVLYFDTSYSLRDRVGDESFPPRGIIRCRIPRFPLVEGIYSINLLIYGAGEYKDHRIGAASLSVETGDFYDTGKTPPASYAPFLAEHEWTVSETTCESQEEVAL